MSAELKLLTGPTANERIPLEDAPLVIGRGGRSALKLNLDSVSWEHAIITPIEGAYFLENLSSFGTLLNRQKISGKVRLRTRDKIELSPDAQLQFIAMDQEGLLKNRAVLITALALMIALVLAVALFNPFNKKQLPDDWDGTFTTLNTWLGTQIAAGKAPTDAGFLFSDGYRLYRDNNLNAAKDRWFKMQLLLDNTLPGYEDAAKSEPAALTHLLHRKSTGGTVPPTTTESSDDDITNAAAIAEFTARMYKFTATR
jgi:pSer/pThr/pTyr-binding forkhead associated (FHA) protein